LKLGAERLALNAVEKSAKGKIGREAPAEGPNDGRRRPQVKSSGNASDNRREPAVATPRDEPAAGERDAPESIANFTLLERVLRRANLQRALKQVRQNQGAPGIDGMSVDDKSYKCNGSHTFIGGATDFARSARRIRPCGNCRRTSAKAAGGWWTSIWKRSLTGSITTGWSRG